MPLAVINRLRRESGCVNRTERHVCIDDTQRSGINRDGIIARHILAFRSAAHHLNRDNPVFDIPVIRRRYAARDIVFHDQLVAGLKHIAVDDFTIMQCML